MSATSATRSSLNTKIKQCPQQCDTNNSSQVLMGIQCCKRRHFALVTRPDLSPSGYRFHTFLKSCLKLCSDLRGPHQAHSWHLIFFRDIILGHFSSSLEHPSSVHLGTSNLNQFSSSQLGEICYPTVCCISSLSNTTQQDDTY